MLPPCSRRSGAESVMGQDLPSTTIGLRVAYQRGELTAPEYFEGLAARVAAHDDPSVWIEGPSSALAESAHDGSHSELNGPLAGVPFAVKDNIDVAGMATTAGCPAYARTPGAHAAAVERLVAAGATPIGKANLDQFATGLVGTRSPYGTPRNPFDPRVIPGGSSSGSAVAVAAGLVPFALGTDTAGSGRVPAALNNVVGLKPTRGLVSNVGVVPACRSLDCVSVFALTARDAAMVLDVVEHHDPRDIYARPSGRREPVCSRDPSVLVVGVPTDEVVAECDPWIAQAFDRHVGELETLGVRIRRVDLTPFLAVGELLYEGPWLAERYAAVGGFIERHPEEVLEVTRRIITAAAQFSGSDVYTYEYRRRELAIAAAAATSDVDLFVVPSVPTVPTVEAVRRDPIGVNVRMGRFTTFVNLLDLSAVAVPGGFGPTGLPVGFTLIGPALADRQLLGLADTYLGVADRPLGATGRGDGSAPGGGVEVLLAVVGAHLSGQPLNHELTSRGARLVRRTTTAPHYRLVALADTDPPRPGLVRSPDGHPIEVEVWSVPEYLLGGFVAGVPAPLAIGQVELADRRWVSGFVCEAVALDGATDITHHRGWRSYLETLEDRDARPVGST